MMLMLVLGASVLGTMAQERRLATSGSTNATSFSNKMRSTPVLQERIASPEGDVIVTKHLQISGPVIHTLKTKRIRDVPKRFVDLLNPFSKAEPAQPIERYGDVSPRAWTTTVGWHPIATRLDDPTFRCDGGLSLVTVGARR